MLWVWVIGRKSAPCIYTHNMCIDNALCMYIYIRACIYIYIKKPSDPNLSIYTYTCVYVHIHTCVAEQASEPPMTSPYIAIYTYIHVCVYIYMCVWQKTPSDPDDVALRGNPRKAWQPCPQGPPYKGHAVSVCV